MNAITPHIVAAPVKLSRKERAVVEALTAVSMIEHRLDSYLRPLAERTDAQLDGSSFYGSVVADCGRDLAALKRGVEELGCAQDDGALKGMGQ